MTRLVTVEITEVYSLRIEDEVERADGTMTPADGTDAVCALDDMDEDDTAAHYQYRHARVTDTDTGDELPVDEGEI